MSIRRTLNLLALLGGLGLSLLVASTQERTATALACPGGAPECTTAANCVDYCLDQTGSPRALCNRAHCCVCIA
jgi:hypothetical protein